MNPRLCKLLGKELSNVASGEKLTTAELCSENCSVGLLFITDEDTSTEHSKKLKDLRDSLVQLHGELKRRSDVSFEVVLIPMNQASCPEDSTTGIKQLFSQEDCPFLLISSEKAERIQGYLARKYGIQDVTSFILIDGTSTDVIVFDAKEKVLQDPKGTQFPWRYPTCSEILDSGQLLQSPSFGSNQSSKTENQSKTNSSVSVVTDFDSIRTPFKALFFAAFWCPPCKSFLTALIDAYERINKDEQKLTIIFVSSDRSQESFNRFFASMPWFAIPYEDEKRREVLTKAYNVKAIPNLTLLDDKDRIITTEGRLEVNDDLDGIEFPWYPSIVDELRDRHSTTLNNSLCVIYFTDDSETDFEKAEAILTPLATEIAKSPIEEACEPKFFVAADSDLAESLRIFMDLDETRSYLVIMDVSNFRYAVQPPEIKDVSESSVKEFLRNFQSKKLTFKYIQSRFV
ncbi:unnamed protein product [Orchesella dallaii]|uniref:Thioredoxin domain-containing protein n=1 Tax=Orchesella dallaii TaxID=48710 RepID=A0ABP1PXN5_9HEXA